MHDIPDTDEADAAAERYFPEEFKMIIRSEVSRSFTDALQKVQAFYKIFEKTYRNSFDRYPEFIRRLAEMIVIGTENGVDEMMEEVQVVLARGGPLPEERLFSAYFWPEPLTPDLKKILHQEIALEFRNHHPYEHLYEDHYQASLSFDAFIDRLAELAVVGAMNGADKAIGNIYEAFLFGSPLPAARRRPRRIR
jgi:hypothetical protein